MVRRLFFTLLSSLVALFPFLYIIYWHALNTHLPVNDEADYFLKSYQIFFQFEEGLWNGLHALFEDRLWKPIGVSASHVLFLFLTGGAVLPSVALQSLALASLICFFMYKIFRIHLRFCSSLVGTGFVLTHPWLLDSLLGVNSENYGLLFCLISVWSILQLSKMPSSKLWSVTYSLSIAMALVYRPFVLGYLFMFDLIGRLARSFPLKNYTSFLVAMTPILVSIGMMALILKETFFSPPREYREEIYLVMMNPLYYSFVWLVCFIWAVRTDRNRLLVYLQILPMTLLFTLYYHSHLNQLFWWLYDCTVGPMSTIAGGRRGRSTAMVVFDLGRSLFFPISIPFILTGAILAVRSKMCISSLKPIVFGGLLFTLVPMITDNTAQRYFFSIAVILLMTSFIFFWSLKSRWRRAAQFIFLLTLCYNMVFMVSVHNPSVAEYVYHIPWNLRSASHVRPLWMTADPARPVADQLATHFSKPAKKRDPYIALLRAPVSEDSYMLDPWAINILLLENRSKVRIDAPYSFTNDRAMAEQEIMKMGFRDFDYFLVGPLENPSTVLEEPNSLLAVRIVSHYKNNTLSQLDMEHEATMESLYPTGMSQKYILLKLKK